MNEPNGRGDKRIDGLMAGRTNGRTDGWITEQKKDACATERTSDRIDFSTPRPCALSNFEKKKEKKKDAVAEWMEMEISEIEVALFN